MWIKNNEKLSILNPDSLEKTLKTEEIVNAAAEEFPCLNCPSIAECQTFAWFIKWFGNPP